MTPEPPAPSPPVPDRDAPARGGLLPVLLGVFVLALAVRVVYLLAFRHSPFFDHLLVDAHWHDEWARAWAGGEPYFGDRAFFRAPLYPAWLALQYAVLGHDLLAVRIVDAILGASAAAAIGGAGLRLGGRAAGWWAGAMAALYGPLVYFGAEFLIPNLLVTLLAWSTFLLASAPRRRESLGGAALLGLAAVARPNALVLLPVAAGWVWHRARGTGRRGAGLAAAATALALVPALVVTGLNLAREGRFVFVAGQGGVNFLAGNHPGATGRSVEIPGLDDLVTWREFTERSRAVAEEAVGRPLASDEVSNWWLHQGLRFWREHPGDALALTGRKLYYLANGFEIPNNRDPYFEQPWPLKPLLWTTPVLSFPWGVVFPLAMAGLVAALADPRRRAAAVWLGSWFLLYTLSLLPFFVSGRFRMGLVPALVLLAGLGLARWRTLLRPAPLVVGLVALVVSNSGFLGATVRNPAQELAKLGAVLAEGGELEAAVARLEESVRLDPREVSAAYLLGDAYYAQHRFGEALEMYDRVTRMRPDDAGARFRLGALLLEMERYEDAARALTLAVQLDPEDAASWINLGVALQGANRPDEAVEPLATGIGLAPHQELGYLALAELHRQRGAYREAVDVLEAGVDRNRGSFELRVQLAMAYARAGRPDLGLEEADAALNLRPDDPRALRLQQRLGELARGMREEAGPQEP